MVKLLKECQKYQKTQTCSQWGQKTQTEQKIKNSPRPKEKYKLRIKTNVGIKAGLDFTSKEWYLAACPQVWKGLSI